MLVTLHGRQHRPREGFVGDLSLRRPFQRRWRYQFEIEFHNQSRTAVLQSPYVKNPSVNQIEILDWPSTWPTVCDAEFPELNGHHAAWVESISKGLRHRAHLITARQSGEVTGVLPLNYVSGPLFGRFLVSLPYINTGGVWAKDSETASELVGAACDLADKLDVRYLELRHELAVSHPKLNFERTEKFHMRMELPDAPEKLLPSFKAKLRNQVKKPDEYGFTVEFGRIELLDSFYGVFARNMRDLGTPVFSRRLFHEILTNFDGDAELCVVRHEGQPVAGGLLVHYGELTEVPSASSLREFNRMGPNMLMYRHLIERAIVRGSRIFDFGRSSEGAGTYKFKAQWGAKPYPAVWQYYVRKGSPEEMRPDSDGNQRLIKIWQRLPVWLTRMIGPSVVRGIP